MAEIIYAKYNKLRRPEFRVRTCVYEEKGSRWVEKTPICPEASKHVHDMADRASALKLVYPKLEFVKADRTETGVKFPYLNGETLDSVLAKKQVSSEEWVRLFREILSAVLPDQKNWKAFQETPEFNQVFGSGAGFAGRKASDISNIDCILENIMADGGQFICFDYEWVMNFPIPVDFMGYRVVHYYYKSHSEASKLIPEEELLRELGISGEDCRVFAQMELAFQGYVFGGDEDCRYTENYRQPVVTYDQMVAEKKQSLHEIDELRKVVGHYEGVERKLRKIGLWQVLQGVQKAGRKVKDIVGGHPR